MSARTGAVATLAVALLAAGLVITAGLALVGGSLGVGLAHLAARSPSPDR
jgi:hypothetical protein